MQYDRDGNTNCMKNWKYKIICLFMICFVILGCPNDVFASDHIANFKLYNVVETRNGYQGIYEMTVDGKTYSVQWNTTYHTVEQVPRELVHRLSQTEYKELLKQESHEDVLDETISRYRRFGHLRTLLFLLIPIAIILFKHRSK